MTEGSAAADCSSIVPASAPEVQDSFDRFAALGDAGENRAIGCEGFLRLTVGDFRKNSLEIIRRVMFQGDRFVLHQAGEDIAAVIPEAEFYRLSCLMDELKPPQFLPMKKNIMSMSLEFTASIRRNF